MFQKVKPVEVLFLGQKKPQKIYFSAISQDWIARCNKGFVIPVVLPWIRWAITKHFRFNLVVHFNVPLEWTEGTPPIIRSANNCIYSIWYLSRRYCYLPLSWKRWNRFECAVGGVRHPQHTQTNSISSTIAADSSNVVTNTRCCRYSWLSSWWWVAVTPETCIAVYRYNKLCNVASCWIYTRIFLRCTDPWTLNT